MHTCQTIRLPGDSCFDARVRVSLQPTRADGSERRSISACLWDGRLSASDLRLDSQDSVSLLSRSLRARRASEKSSERIFLSLREGAIL